MVSITNTGTGMVSPGPFASVVSPLLLLYSREQREANLALANNPIQGHAGPEGLGISWQTLFAAYTTKGQLKLNENLESYQGEKRCMTMAFHNCSLAWDIMTDKALPTNEEIAITREDVDGSSFLSIYFKNMEKVRIESLMRMEEIWLTRARIAEERVHYRLIGLGGSGAGGATEPLVPIVLPLLYRGKSDITLLADVIATEVGGEPITAYMDGSRLAYFTGCFHWLLGITSFDPYISSLASLFYYIHHSHLDVASLLSLAARGGIAPRLGSMNVSNSVLSGTAWQFLTAVGLSMEYADKWYYKNTSNPNTCYGRAIAVGMTGIPEAIPDRINEWLASVHIETEQTGGGLTFLPYSNAAGLDYNLMPFGTSTDLKKATTIEPFRRAPIYVHVLGECPLSKEGLVVATEEQQTNVLFNWDVLLPEPTQMIRSELYPEGIGLFSRQTTVIDVVDETPRSTSDLAVSLCTGWKPPYSYSWLVMQNSVGRGQLAGQLGVCHNLKGVREKTRYAIEKEAEARAESPSKKKGK